MKLRAKEVLRTTGFMGLLSFVLITAVSALHLATAKRVGRNTNLFLQRAVLGAAGVPVPPDPAATDALFQNLVTAEPAGNPDRFVVRQSADSGRRTVVYRRTGRGLWGTISAVIATDPAAGTFDQMRVLEHNETPGLGARIEEPWFQQQIEGKTGPFVLKPEGTRSTATTEIDAITGATISSAAVRDMLNDVVRTVADEKESALK